MANDIEFLEEPTAGGGDAHQPVLREEFLRAARVAPGAKWVDGTFGRGGHTKALLESGAEVLALDQDEAAEEAAQQLMQMWPGKLQWNRSNFVEIKKCTEKIGWEKVDGVLLDLGVSSPQFDTGERGFSFRFDGPLDMRMDRRQALTAQQLIQETDEKELVRIFFEYGEEPAARKIARALVARRDREPITRTSELAELVAAIAGSRRARHVHPATKVFQALRIAVNREREALLAVLPLATSILNVGGALSVISFHSGEDRVVKDFLRRRSEAYLDTPHHPQSFANPEQYFSEIKRYMPSEAELEKNPRARSARLRVGYRNEVVYGA